MSLVMVPLLTGGDTPLLDVVEEPDSAWTSLALHCYLVALCLKERFSLEEVRHLQMVMLEQHKVLKEVHPLIAKRHKFHMTLHIPQQILMFGPCRHYWCMRFEAKHQEIKRLDRLINFINLPATVCKLSAMVQGIRVHHKAARAILEDEFDDRNGALCVFSSFAVPAECTELTSALYSVCNGLAPGALELEGAIRTLGHVAFGGRKWQARTDIIFFGSLGWESARITSIWYVVASCHLLFKVVFHGPVLTAPNALGTDMVNMFSGGGGFVCASEPTLRLVHVLPTNSELSVGWILEA